MTKSGELSIELRLALNRLRNDTKNAAAIIKSELGSTAATAATEKAAQADDRHTGAIRRKTKALEDQLQAWRKIHAGGVAPGQKVTIGGTQTGAGGGTPWSTNAGGGLATTPPYTGATPPIVPPPVMAGGAPANSIAGMFNSAVMKPLSQVGQVATKVFAGLAALRVGIGLVTYPFRLLSQTMMPVVRMFTQAAEAARAMYARSLTSGGLPIGFTAHRSLLAETIGVSEKDVYQYADAVKYLNNSLAFASNAMAQTNRNLTSASWSMRVVGADLRALTALFSDGLAPAVREFMSALHGIALMLGGEAKKWGMIMGLGIKMGLNNMTGGLYGMLAKMAGLDKGQAPSPTTGAHRYATSQWERMGMVIGLGSSNPAAQTARNTQNMVVTLKTIAGYLRGGPPRANGVPAWAYSQP